MGFQTENRVLANKVNAALNKQVEVFDRIERLEELVRGLTDKMRKIEDAVTRLEKSLAAQARKSGL